MKLKMVYMNSIELQNKIFIEVKELHGMELSMVELNFVIQDYLKECEKNPQTTFQFLQTYWD